MLKEDFFFSFNEFSSTENFDSISGIKFHRGREDFEILKEKKEKKRLFGFAGCVWLIEGRKRKERGSEKDGRRFRDPPLLPFSRFLSPIIRDHNDL